MSPEPLPISAFIFPAMVSRGLHSGQLGVMAGSGPLRLFWYRNRKELKPKADALKYASGMLPVRRLPARCSICVLVSAAYSGGNVPAQQLSTYLLAWNMVVTVPDHSNEKR